MKIDYNKFSILRYVRYGVFRPTVCLDDMKLIKDAKIAETFTAHHKQFHKVYFISKTFYEALEKSRDKLWDILEVEHGNIHINGTYVFQREDGITETYCFEITHDNTLFYYFQGDKLLVFKNGDIEYVESSVIEIDKETGEWGEDTVQNRVVSQLVNILFFHLFYKFAEIETKIIKQKTKFRSGFNCVYNNQTDLNVTFLNSTWFTNLVKSDAFKVSGHFRLQPCHDENGLPTKKLIWISDFVKNGYTAPARKLKNNL